MCFQTSNNYTPVYSTFLLLLNAAVSAFHLGRESQRVGQRQHQATLVAESQSVVCQTHWQHVSHDDCCRWLRAAAAAAAADVLLLQLSLQRNQLGIHRHLSMPLWDVSYIPLLMSNRTIRIPVDGRRPRRCGTLFVFGIVMLVELE